MKTISQTHALNLCAAWHGGQWSALYQFASSGKYLIENHLRYLQEITQDEEIEYFAAIPPRRTKKDYAELARMRRFFEAKGRENSIGTVWHTHPDYGYKIPFVSNETNDELGRQITPLRWLS